MGNYKETKDFLKRSYNTASVPRGINYWTRFLLTKCQRLFVYENLPMTIPAWELEKALIVHGVAGVVKKKGELYVVTTGNAYGYDAYNVPNKYTYANPVLGSGSCDDLKSCAIVWNTEVDKIQPNTSILFETIQRYSRMLADLESTFQSILVAQRAGRLGTALNSQVAQAVDEVMTKLEMGETKTIINSSQMLDTFKPLNFAPTGSMPEFSQTRDYLLNCFYNEIGLQTLEEKKERMISGELEVDGDVLENNISEMFYSRLLNVEKINYVFKDELEKPITVKMNKMLGGR